jgi:hypothetical protein
MKPNYHPKSTPLPLLGSDRYTHFSCCACWVLDHPGEYANPLDASNKLFDEHCCLCGNQNPAGMFILIRMDPNASRLLCKKRH